MKTIVKKTKKTIEDYMKLPYRMVIVPDEEEGGYTLYFPDLPGCVTCVESLDEAKAMSEDAKREWLKAAIEDGVDIKEPQEEYSGQLRLRMPKSLHRQLSRRASEEGVSLNQYVVYELGRAVAQ